MSELDFTYFFPQVLQAVPAEDFKVYAYFNDGSIHCIDVKPLIQPGTVFWQLRDIEIFKSKLTVLNNTVAWDIAGCRNEYDCIDIDPETIFDGPEVAEPLWLRSPACVDAQRDPDF